MPVITAPPNVLPHHLHHAPFRAEFTDTLEAAVKVLWLCARRVIISLSARVTGNVFSVVAAHIETSVTWILVIGEAEVRVLVGQNVPARGRTHAARLSHLPVLQVNVATGKDQRTHFNVVVRVPALLQMLQVSLSVVELIAGRCRHTRLTDSLIVVRLVVATPPHIVHLVNFVVKTAVGPVAV